MKYGIILVFLLLCMPLVLATDNVGIFDDKLTIKIYNTSKQDYEGTSLTSFKIEFISQEDSHNNKAFPFSVNLSSQNINYESEIFDYRVVIIGTLKNISLYDELMNCVKARAGLDTGYKICNLNLVECLEKYEGENATTYKEELDNCNILIKEKDLTLGSKNNEVRDLEKEKDDTKNSKYFWGFGCFIIGIVVMLFYTGKIGKGAVKERSMGEHSKTQAG